MGNCCGKNTDDETQFIYISNVSSECSVSLSSFKQQDEIYKVYELSDKRIAVELIYSIKIYSLKTFQLITEINHDKIDNSIELKNKDIAITDYNTFYFYNLSNNNYNNYLKIKENEKKIFEIYELKNENLILCIRHCLIIYAKGKDDYTYLSEFKLNETVGKIIEIKNNILFLFLQSRCSTYITADYSPYYLHLLDIEKKGFVELDSGLFSRYDHENIIYGCNLVIKNNKYLCARYAGSFCIWNIEKDDPKEIKIIYKINYETNKEDFPLDFKSLCNYDNESFIIIPSREIYKYDESINKIIKKQKFNIEIEEIIDIIKLNNNNFVANNKNELFLINDNYFKKLKIL